MKVETFFEAYERLADAPNAIAKMRELVLQLAVRGRLTHQSQLESSVPQLVLAESFRKQRGKRSEPDSSDVPFLTPKNWGWVAVGDCMNMINGRAFRPEEWSTEGTPIIRIQNLNNEAAPFNYCKFDVDPKVHVQNGDFLISWSGTPGTSFGAFIWHRAFAYLNQHIFRCELVEGVFQKEFLRLAVNARLDEMISHAQGAVGLRHITKGKLEGIRLPLPPLAEQKRIVAKVDELMALCDRLEAQQQERDKQHAALARASLARFADVPTPANLEFLFHKSYAINPADLRKSILDLAVHGNLIGGTKSKRATLAEVIELISGQHLLADEQNQEGRGIPYLTGPSDFGQKNPVPTRWTETPKVIALPGDILITVKGSGVGKTNMLISEPTAISRQLMAVRVTKAEPEFVHLVLRYAADHFQSLMTGIAIPGIGRKDVLELEAELPPPDEQRHIVAKVDQLMTLVDQLEALLSESRATATRLIEAVVAELTAKV